MSVSPPIARHTSGKTFLIASSLLGLAALGQLGALCWALATRTPPQTLAAAPAAPAGEPGRELAPQPSEPGEKLPVSDPLEFAAVTPAPAEPRAEPIAPPPKPVPLSATKLALKAPPDTRYQELVEQGRILRDRGDTGSALTRLREAQTLDPSSAQAVAEIAITYEKMGLLEKASEHWRRILEMGDGTGSYYIAAEAKLKQSQAMALLATRPESAAATPENKTMGLGEITAVDEVDPLARKKFTLHVPIKQRVSGRIDNGDVHVEVRFFEMVDGKSLVKTSANLNTRWASAPADWEGGETETLDVHYSQPRSDPRAGPAEDRKYFGYIVRLYYKSELQETHAEPPRLAAEFPSPLSPDPDSK